MWTVFWTCVLFASLGLSMAVDDETEIDQYEGSSEEKFLLKRIVKANDFLRDQKSILASTTGGSTKEIGDMIDQALAISNILSQRMIIKTGGKKELGDLEDDVTRLENIVKSIEHKWAARNSPQNRVLGLSTLGNFAMGVGGIAYNTVTGVGGAAIGAVGAVAQGVYSVLELLVTRRDILVKFIGDVIAEYSENGYQGLAQLLKPAIESLKDSSEDFKNAVDSFAEKLEMSEEGIHLLNSLTGGRYTPINAISTAIKGLDSVTGILKDRSNSEDRNLLVTRLVGILVKTKSSGARRVQGVLSRVCVAIEGKRSTTAETDSKDGSDSSSDVSNTS